MDNPTISRRGFLKIGTAAALASTMPSFLKNAAAESVSLEHLIEKTFPNFIISGYDSAVNPSDENISKYKASEQALRNEEQKAIEKGLLKYSLDSDSGKISQEMNEKGYTYERLKVPENIDSYILGKIAKKESEGRFTVFLHKPLVPTFDAYKGKPSGAYRIGSNVYADLAFIEGEAKEILENKSSNQLEKIYFTRISDQFRGNSQKIADDIFYTFKIHEIKGHTGFGTVEDEERAMLTEIAEANSMYPIYRVWEMTSNKDSDWLHKKASMLAMEELAKYKNSQGRNYEGEVLARANLAKIKNVAGQILKNKF